MNFEEIRHKMTENQVYLGIELGDLDIFEAYKNPDAKPENGFYTDFSGVRTRLSYFGMQAHPGERKVGALPFPDDALHAETIEYLAALKAVESADQRFTAVELGAGYGPWTVFSACAARRKGIPQIDLLAVEADRPRLALIESNLSDNDLPTPDEQGKGSLDGITINVTHGAVSDQNGTTSFGSQSITDWGAGVIEDGGDIDYRGVRVETELVNTYSIETILRNTSLVDFLHMDIQGFEYRAVRASMDTLQRKVRIMLIATHSRKIEGELMGLLHQRGWTLMYEKPCKFRPGETKELSASTYLDGTQVWVNTSLGEPTQVVDDMITMQEKHEKDLEEMRNLHQGELHAIKNSTSWRISAPLRWVKSTLSSRGQ